MTDLNDYSKTRIDHVAFHTAVDNAMSGWICARDAWPAGKIIFVAKSGSFVATDLTTGYFSAFMVVRKPDGTYHPWAPSEDDMQSKDWICITRQTFANQMTDQVTKLRNEEEPKTQKHIAIEDYAADADTTDMA